MSSSVLAAPTSPVPSSTESTRRQLSARQAATVQRLTVAAVEELREHGYDGLTVRNVARAAGVAPATAYTYFTSREHLVTEVFWRRLEAMPETRLDRRRSTAARVGATMSDFALLVADEPELAAACTVAMLATDPDVKLPAGPHRPGVAAPAGHRPRARTPPRRCWRRSSSSSRARCCRPAWAT